MPGFAVHYLFGEETINNYDNDLVRKSVDRYRDVYNLGLQGPDLFFYFFISPVFFKKNVGSIMHRIDIGLFKKNYIELLDRIDDREKSMIALSYFAGFIGHCTLDKICHPYVYAVTDYAHKDKNYFAKHVELETEIDSIYIKKYKDIDLYGFNCRYTVNLDNAEIDVVAEIFSQAVTKTYTDVSLSKNMMIFVIRFYLFFLNIFKDKCGIKKKIVRIVERFILRKQLISPLFVEREIEIKYDDPVNIGNNQWISPWETDIIRIESFDELFSKAVLEYNKVLSEINSYLENNDKEILKLSIENISLHSGLDCSIPS